MDIVKDEKVGRVWINVETGRKAVIVRFDQYDIRYKYLDGKRECWAFRAAFHKKFRLLFEE